MAYEIKDHPLLSSSARLLPDAERAAHTRMAEHVLGLAGYAFAGEDLEAAKDAIVLQVNYQVDELPDRGWGSLKEDERIVWNEDSDVHPLAKRMAGRLTGTGRRFPIASVKAPVGFRSSP